MGKMKLYELAKEMEITSKELLEKAKKIGINVKSHLSSLEDEDIKILRANIGKKVLNNENTKTKKEDKKEVISKKENSSKKEIKAKN